MAGLSAGSWSGLADSASIHFELPVLNTGKLHKFPAAPRIRIKHKADYRT